MERASERRHACKLTRESVSVSSQLTIWAVRTQAESRPMRAPKSGRTVPAAALKTISLVFRQRNSPGRPRQ
jgi:hypothetical protein